MSRVPPVTETATVEQLGRALLKAGPMADLIFSSVKSYRVARARHAVWHALYFDCVLSYRQIADMFPMYVSDRSGVRYGVEAHSMRLGRARP